MKERLLTFLFVGILLALVYHQAMALAYRHFFPTSSLYQTYWYVPLLVVPALLLSALAWWMGFFRKLGWEDAAALAILAAITVLTLEAPYSCWMGCF
jgi:hypothetical protein